jgi:hypothetical protein
MPSTGRSVATAARALYPQVGGTGNGESALRRDLRSHPFEPIGTVKQPAKNGITELEIRETAVPPVCGHWGDNHGRGSSVVVIQDLQQVL